MRLLLVEDNAKLAEQLAKGLQESGHVVDLSARGDDALALAGVRDYDAILLDIGLPGRSGWVVLNALRGRGDLTPVICITASDTVDARVRGLNAGADDYLVKPFAFAELLARLNAVMRRSAERGPDVIRVADLEVDLPARRAKRAGRVLDLRPKEFALLAALARQQGQVLSRAAIVDRVWEASFDYDSNVVDVQIRRLRETVDDPFAVKLIHTVRGAGYVLEERP